MLKELYLKTEHKSNHIMDCARQKFTNETYKV